MATVATLTIDLVGQSAKLQSELKKANKATQGWAKQTRSHVNAVGKFMAGAGVAGAGALTAVYASAAKEADQLAKTADKLGVLPEALSGIQYAGELTGVSINTTNMALQRMTRRVAEAAQGTGEAVGALDELGVNAERLAQLSPDEQFKVLADAMSDVSNQGDRVRLSMKLFDSEGVALVNTLKLGSEGLNAMQTEADQLGLTLDRVDLAKIEAANDNFHRAKVVTSAFGKTLASEVSPLVGALAKEFADSAKEAGGFTSVVVNGVDTVTTGVGYAADAVRGLKAVWVGVKLAVAKYMEITLAGLVKVDEGITFLLNKIPGVEASTSTTLANIQSSFATTANDISQDFQDLALSEMPSEKIKAWVQKVQATALEEAKLNAANSSSILAQVSGTEAAGSSLSLDKAGSTTEESEKKIREKEAKDIIKIEENKYTALDSMAENHIGSLIRGQADLKSASGSLARQAVAETIKAKAVESKATGFAAIQQAWASAPFPANLGAVAMTTAKTLATTAAIQALTAPSFDGGGYTGSGARVGGLDGKGGFPAILHPNETVVDHTKGQGMGAVVNIHNHSGQPIEQRQNGNQVEIIVGRVKDAIRDDLSRGRDLANDFQSTYGLTRRGMV